MRIISLLPAATEIVCYLGLQNQLQGISHGCNYPNEVRSKPRISYTDVNYDSLPSYEIDQYVENSMKSKKSLYHLDQQLIGIIKPTHILTQALCDVCAITPSDIQKVIYNIKPLPKVIELNPRSIKDIYEDVVSLGKEFNKTTKAKKIVTSLKEKINKIQCQTQNLPKKTVFCLEWLDPLYACGHWVPEMVEIAGGIDPLSFPNKYSTKISWKNVINENPEILIVMPCSFSIKKTLQELSTITKKTFWKKLRAVQNNNVWVVDGSSYFNQSGIRTIDRGVEILAKIIHPEIFGKPTKKDAVQIML